MIALLKKDAILMAKHFSLIYIVPILFPMIVVIQNPQFFPVVVTMALSLAFALQPLTTINFDEKSNWQRMLSTMPLIGKYEVISKFLLSLIIALTSSVLIMLLLIIASYFPVIDFELNLFFFFAGMGFTMSLAYNMIVIPAAYKFGTMKCRYVLLIFIFTPVLAVNLANFFGLEFDMRLPDLPVLVYIVLWLITLMSLLFISIFISIKIRSKKS